MKRNPKKHLAAPIGAESASSDNFELFHIFQQRNVVFGGAIAPYLSAPPSSLLGWALKCIRLLREPISERHI